MGNKHPKGGKGEKPHTKSLADASPNAEDDSVKEGKKRAHSIGKFSTTLLPDDTDDNFPEGERVTLDDFELMRIVGRGSFGKVVQVRCRKDDQIYAMKVLRKDMIFKRKQVEHTKTERRILERIDHPFIVSLRFAFQTGDKLYMVLDYFNGGELFYHLSKSRRFKEDRVRFYVAEIVLAIEYLHTLDIIYRDLKPENILLDDEGHIKLTDFGLAKEGIDLPNGAKTFCGTPEYLAPEIILNKGHGKAVDWWALGAITFELLTGVPPYYNKNRQVMYEMILKMPVNFPDYISQEAQGLISKLMIKNHQLRLGATGARKIKEHSFFKGIDWEAMAKRSADPPFIPVVEGGASDVKNFDKMFTSQEIKDTPVDSLSLNKRNAFGNFTYEGDGGELEE